MKFFVSSTDPIKIEADMLAVFVSGPHLKLSDDAKKVDTALGGMGTEAMVMEDLKGELASTFLVHSHKKIASKNILFVGLGKATKLTVFELLKISAAIGKRAKNAGAKRLAIAIPVELSHHFSTSTLSEYFVEGITLGTYTFTRHKGKKSQKEEKILEFVTLLVPVNKIQATTAGIQKGEIIADGVCFTRDLVNEPPSVTTPTNLAEVAGNIANNSEYISCTVLDAKDAKKLGMGAFLGVAVGSDEEPRFIHLTYSGGGGKTIVLVGKGITFDSGGLSLKPSKSMETMKSDMAGAAAVLGIFKVLSRLKPKINVVGLIAATENMPSGKALKPGDIVTAMNSKTIEVFNTDAEGRLVLADALSYATAKTKPDVIIDIATLTGACEVALGTDIAGLFSNRTDLTEKLKKAALESGELIWELPLAEDVYKEDMLKSSIADIKNISQGHYGGAINGALFLSEFVPETIPWAHLDIAGPSYTEKGTDLTPKGGTGFGVRMILQFLLND
jgi:leucyl aminopeptidase